MGVLCMVMLSSVTSVNSEPPDTVSKTDYKISKGFFLVLLRGKASTAVEISSELDSNKTSPRGL